MNNPSTEPNAIQNAIVAGMFPMSGRYSATAWALMLGCCVRTVQRYVELYRVPYRKPGDEMFIDAADFWNAIPVQRKSPTKKRRRAAQ